MRMLDEQSRDALHPLANAPGALVDRPRFSFASQAWSRIAP
jgi:hypothetical protein